MTESGIRVTVALDPAAPRDEVFEALVALFDPALLEVTALFIEDDNLMRLASLPGARQIRLGPAPDATGIDLAALRRQFADRAARMRATCEAASARLRIRSTHFLVCRGEVLAELERMGSQCELLVVGRSLHSAAVRSWLGAGPERIAHRLGRLATPGALLFVHEPWRTGSCVLAVTDGSEDADRAMARAGVLARAEGLPLQALTLSPGPPAIDAMAAACARADARVLVLPRSVLGEDDAALSRLVAKSPASILLTR